MNGKLVGALAFTLAAAVGMPAQTWKQVGPPGGNVISLEADPHNLKKLYLGTSDGHVFVSSDEGQRWELLSRIGTGQDDVVTHLIVDPRDSNRIYASTWTLYSGGGGVYRSDDAGKSWKLIGLGKETVRALAQSSSNQHVFAAGSLTGVYISKDDGENWTRITNSTENPDLINFDSVVFDPHSENIIYAGTYHLPWKTSDGGKSWQHIEKGMIDDSDVMSIIVDPADPQNVHATACSGIYHSVNGAENWKRYSGIPFVFRRTQLIRQDPSKADTLYAGTTSGLWKTTNEGGEWKRMTPGDWVVNALLIDPQNPQRIIIGTEREGVQISENGGGSFQSANNGFQHQHLLDVAVDSNHPERALVVLAFDNDAFLETRDSGSSWRTLGAGLKRTDLRHVYATPNGWWASLANGGWERYEEAAGKWVKAGLFIPDSVAQPETKPAPKSSKRGTTTARRAPVKKTPAPQLVAFQVNDMAFGRDAWYAATEGGVLISKDQGKSWKMVSKDPLVRTATQSLEISTDGSQLWAISQKALLYSSNGGESWDGKDLPFAAAGNLRLHHVDDANVFVTTNMGLYVTHDAGRNWSRADIRDLQFRSVAGSGAAFVVALQKHGLLTSHDGGKSWEKVKDPVADGYFPVVTAKRDGTVVAASSTEGLLTMDSGSGTTRAVSSDPGGSAAAAPVSDMQKPRQ